MISREGWYRIYVEGRFWSKVEKTEGCWIWKGATTRGYGVFKAEDKLVYAHNFSFENTSGPIPEGKELDHLCKNTLCVKPSHLEPVTHKQNMERSIQAMKTHCVNGHPLLGNNLVPTALKRGKRACLICARKRNREWGIKIYQISHPNVIHRKTNSRKPDPQ